MSRGGCIFKFVMLSHFLFNSVMKDNARSPNLMMVFVASK